MEHKVGEEKQEPKLLFPSVSFLILLKEKKKKESYL